MPKLSSVSCAVFQPNDQPCQGYFHQKLKVFPIRYWSIIFTLVCVWSSPASDTNQYGLVNGWPTDAHLRITQMSNGKYERFQEGTAQFFSLIFDRLPASSTRSRHQQQMTKGPPDPVSVLVKNDRVLVTSIQIQIQKVNLRLVPIQNTTLKYPLLQPNNPAKRNPHGSIYGRISY